MEIIISRTNQGNWYVSTFLKFGNSAIVTKQVGDAEANEILSELKHNAEALEIEITEKPVTDQQSHCYIITEKLN